MTARRYECGSGTISRQDAQYAWDIVNTICAKVGPGTPGTPQERERAAIFRQELESHLGAGNVAVEEFTLAPGAFLGAQRLSGFFMLAAAILNLSPGRFAGIPPCLNASAALAFSILAVLVYLLEFVRRSCAGSVVARYWSRVGRATDPGDHPASRPRTTRATWGHPWPKENLDRRPDSVGLSTSLPSPAAP